MCERINIINTNSFWTSPISHHFPLWTVFYQNPFDAQKVMFPFPTSSGGHSKHIVRGLKNEFLGCFPLQCPGVQLLIPLQHRRPRSLLYKALMTGLMASVMKATPVWPSSSSNLRLLNSLLQQPNCENELLSPPRALPGTTARFQQPLQEHGEAALTAPVVAAQPLLLPHQSISEGGVCSAGRGSRLPAGVCRAHTGKRRQGGERKAIKDRKSNS